MKLYEITALEAEMEREDDEEIKNTLQEMIAAELKEKSENIVKVVKNSENYINGIDAEIKRLQEMKKQQEKKLQQFKEYVLYNMQQMKLDKIPTVLGVLKISKSTRTEIDESKLPQTAFDIVQTLKRKSIAELDEMGLTQNEGVEKVVKYSLNVK